ncbi:MAG: hypothetical protein IKG55_05925, partial [Solobacterium sp.]|nr:hypothetical protein [Solobacterium sp.]
DGTPDRDRRADRLGRSYKPAGSVPGFINKEALFFLRNNLVLLIIAAIACTPIAKSGLNPFKRQKFSYLIPAAVLCALIICTAFIVDASYNPFLYFRF